MTEELDWTREHPVPPEQDPPDHYWFIYDGEEHEVVVDVWPGRKYWPRGQWWPEKIASAPKRPKPMIKKKKKEQKNVTKRRGKRKKR